MSQMLFHSAARDGENMSFQKPTYTKHEPVIKNAMNLVWSKYLAIIQKYQFHPFSQVVGKMSMAI